MPEFEYGPEVCTCGAKLPPDARFCHKCGKPQREEPVLAVEEEPVQAPIEPPDLPVVAAPPKIGFHNGAAVRIALITGVCGIVFSMISGQLPGLQVLAVLSPVASGFFASILYRQRTHQPLSLRSGAHLGWLAGIFGFVITTILITLFAAMLSAPDFVAMVRQQAQERQHPEIMQAIQEFRSPSGLAQVLFGTFIVFTLLPVCGGALGAKLLGRDSGANRG